MKQTTNNRQTLKVSGQIVSVPALRTGSLSRTPGISNWREVVGMFITSQDVGESSRGLYTRTLSQFFLWIEKTKKDLKHLTREDILEYKDSLLESGLSSLTISSYLVVVRKFYEWTEGLKIYPNPAHGQCVVHFEKEIPQVIRLYTISGVLCQEIIPSKETIELSLPTAGVFILNCEMKECMVIRRIVSR